MAADTEEAAMSSTARHRAEPVKRVVGKRFTLIALGGIIALTGVVAGGAGILGVLQL